MNLHIHMLFGPDTLAASVVDSLVKKPLPDQGGWIYSSSGLPIYMTTLDLAPASQTAHRSVAPALDSHLDALFEFFLSSTSTNGSLGALALVHPHCDRISCLATLNAAAIDIVVGQLHLLDNEVPLLSETSLEPILTPAPLRQRYLPREYRLDEIAGMGQVGMPSQRFCWSNGISRELPWCRFDIVEVKRDAIFKHDYESVATDDALISGLTRYPLPVFQGDQVRLGWPSEAPSSARQFARLVFIALAKHPKDEAYFIDSGFILSKGLDVERTLVLDDKPGWFLPVVIQTQGREIESSTLAVRWQEVAERHVGVGVQVLLRALAATLRDALIREAGSESIGVQVALYPALLRKGRYPVGFDPRLQRWRSLMNEGRHALILEQIADSSIEHQLPADRLEMRLLEAVAHRRRHQMQISQEILESLINEATFLDCPHFSARCLKELARYWTEKGDYDRALAMLHECVKRFESQNDPLEAAKARLNLAYLHSLRDEFESCLTQNLLILATARDAAEWRIWANAQEGAGQAAMDLGDYHTAQQCFDQAFHHFASLNDERSLMQIYGDLSILAYALNRGPEALRHAEQQWTLAQALEQGSPSSSVNLSMAHLNRGRACLLLLRPCEALSQLQQALSLTPEHEAYKRALIEVALAEVAILLDDPREALRWVSTTESTCPSLLGISGNQKSVSKIELIWQHARIKAQCLERLGNPSGVEQTFQQANDQVEAWRSGLSEAARTHALQIIDRFQIEYVSHMIEYEHSAQKVVVAIEASRARSFSDLLAGRWSSPIRPSAPFSEREIAELQQLLPSCLTVLSFFCLNDSLLIFRIAGNSLELRQVPCSAQRLQSVLDEVALELGRRPFTTHTGAVLQELSDLLLANNRDWLPQADSGQILAIVEQGLLRNVPWHALPVQVSSETVPLGTAGPVFRVPSLRAFTLLRRLEPWGTEIEVVMAAPSSDLPFAVAEASAVLLHFPQAHRHCGTEVTLQSFCREAPRARLLHLAMHAEADDSLGHLRLVLHSSPATAPQSWIDAASLRQVRLDAALVVLSACSANVGTISTNSEAPDVLPRQMLLAGARSVISTGWRIYDEGGAEFFSTFYREIKRGLRFCDALFEAQKEAYRRAVSVEDWLRGPGAFVLDGDGLLQLGLGHSQT